MAVRPIVRYDTAPEILRQVSAPIDDADADLPGLVTDLKETLRHHADGIGLAAPQIGVHRRAIVVCFGTGKEGEHGPPVAIINPVIVESGRELPDFDGCLSIPGIYAQTVRPHFMKLRGIDERGEPFLATLEGFDAVVVHHEVDHLNGILFIDRVASPEKLHPEAEGREVRLG